MPPTDNAPYQGRKDNPKKRKNPLAGVGGSVNASGGKAPAKRKPAPRRPVQPAPNLINDTVAAVTGTVRGVRRSVARGDSGAQAQRSIARNVARKQREVAVRDYTSMTRADRAKAAAAAQKRVSAGRGSEKDRLIVQTHERRVKNISARPPGAVKAANARHDREVQLAQLQDAIGKLRAPRIGDTSPSKKKGSGLLGGVVDLVKSAPGDLVSGTRKNVASVVKGAADATIGVSNAVVGLSELDPLGTSDGNSKYTQAGIDPSGPLKAAVLVPKVAANVARVGAEDPSTLKRIPGDLKSMVVNIPASVVQAAKDPEGAGKGIVDDYKRRYGPLIAGRDKEFRKRLKQEGFTPELVDVLGSVQTGAATRITSGGARAVARSTPKTWKVNRAANAADRFLRDERPDRLVAPGRAVPQRKAKTLPGITRQRFVDNRRAARVTREQDRLKAAQTPLPTPTTKAGAKAVRKAQVKRQKAGGKGVRGMIPAEGQVVARFASTRKRDLRKATSRVASTGFRRIERLGNELSRDAERRFNTLKIPEQRAAVYALEGTINIDDAAASIRAVDLRVKQIKAERQRMRTEQPEQWDREYLPIVNDPDVDELVRLQELKGQLQTAPEQVLTPKLRQFIEGEQARRPRVEQIAGDELRPSTILARRFGPVGELTGTRDAYAPRRAALDRLEKTTPDAALRQLGLEIKRSRAARTPDGGRSRKLQQLAAEVRAVRQVAEGRPSNKRIPADVLDSARTVEAETFARATRTAARGKGLGDIEPTYVLHTKRDSGGANAYATGGAERGAVAGSKRSDMSLVRKGFRDTSGRAYAQGIQGAIKRSVQWRMVNELMQDLVPAWGKNGGKGFTLREWQEATRRQVLDPQDWVVYKPHREERTDVDTPDLDDADGLPDGDTVGLNDLPNVDWDPSDRFYVIPVDAFNEMKRAQGPLANVSRGIGRFTGGQTQLILASMPQYGIRQVAQSVPIVLVQVGRKWVSPTFWANLKAYRRAAKLAPDEWRDLQDVLGVRSKSADAVKTERRGSQQFDVRRFEGQLQHTWGGLFGAAAKDWWVAPRRSTGAAGTASQAARTAAKVTLAPFRAVRDMNMALDAWQDSLGRTLGLAAADARLLDSGRWAEEVAASTTGAARKLGPIAASLDAGPAERAALSRSKWFRQATFDAADDVTRLFGDYANYTQREQLVARRVVPFYGFARHSTRLLFNVLPLEHPLSLAIVLAASNADRQEKEVMFRDWLKRTQNIDLKDLPNSMVAGYRFVMHDSDKLEIVDERWLNPLTGPVFEALVSGPGDAAGSTFTPALKGSLESVFQTNLFTKQRLSNAQGQADADTNPLTMGDQARVIGNRFMSSLYPFRVWNDQVNGEKGKLTDTSLPFDAKEYPYKRLKSGKPSKSMKRNEERKKTQASQSPIERLLDMTVPERAKPITTLLNAATFEADRQAKKNPKKKRKSPTGSFGGGTSFGGGGSFGGSGTFGGGGEFGSGEF